jgi:hypothetical protein
VGAYREEKLRAYVEQIALHASVEAFKLGARQLRFHYSIPTAFSRNMENQVKAIWKDSIEWLRAETGMDCVPPERSETESIAAAKYFCHSEYPSHALPEVGAVFVDIGVRLPIFRFGAKINYSGRPRSS